MSSTALDQLLGGAPAAGGPPPSIPDPEPHLAPNASAPDPNDPLAALLGAALPGGGAPGGGAPDEPDTSGAPEEPDPLAGGAPNEHVASEVDALHSLIDAGQSYMQIPTVEPAEKAKMNKALQIFHDLLADNQKNVDSLTGANPALRKALGPQ